MDSFKPVNNKAGFTLIELMITVALIAILGAVSMAIYTPFRQKAKCQQAVVAAHDTMALLIDDVAEDGVAPDETTFNSTLVINQQDITFPATIQVQFSGNGTATNQFIVDAKRTDFTCPNSADGIYTLEENQMQGTW